MSSYQILSKLIEKWGSYEAVTHISGVEIKKVSLLAIMGYETLKKEFVMNI